MRDDICLLLTSTIEVKNKSLVARNDTQQRLADYTTALRHWVTKQKGLSKIVLVDNSGYPLDSLRKTVDLNNPRNKQVELLSYVPKNPEHINKSNSDKSYGEIDIIDYALKKSQSLKASKFFLKVTGRLFVPNIDKIINGLPVSFHTVANYYNNLAYVDTTLILFERIFYQNHIADFSKRIVDPQSRTYIERAYAKAILSAITKDYQWFPLPEEPIIEGMSGTKNKPYGRGRLKSLRGTLLSRLYHDFYRTSYGKNRPHLLKVWGVKPGDNSINNE